MSLDGAPGPPNYGADPLSDTNAPDFAACAYKFRLKTSAQLRDPAGVDDEDD